MAAAGIATITAPQLKSVLGEDLLAFQIKYEAYLTKVDEFNQGRTQAQRIPPSGIKSCIDPELLRSLVLLQTFPGTTSASELTEQQLKSWLETRSRVSHKALDSQVTDALKRVKFKPKNADPQGAALQFFASVTTELARNRATQVLEQAPKALIEQLVPKLEPRRLREKVQSSMKYWRPEDKKRFNFFVGQVTSIYVDIASYIDEHDVLKDKNGEHKGPDKVSKRNRKDKAGNRESGEGSLKAADNSRDQNKGHKNAPKQPKKRKSAEWKERCLNPECDKFHRIVDCENTTEDGKKRFLKEYYESKKKPKVAGVKRSPLGDGRWKCVINEAVDAVALGDYGADDSAVSANVVRVLKEKGIQVPIETFNAPLKLTPAVELTKDDFTASGKAQIDITVVLPCGPLRLRKVEFLVIDQDMDEILLGRPLLKCLGFNLDTHLEKVRDKYNEANISELMDQSGGADNDLSKLSKVSSFGPYTGLWHNQAEEDPIELPESAGANVGVDREEDVQAAFKTMLAAAKENGMSGKGMKEAEAMLQEYRDIFRIKLGPDPPAKVEPLQIKLKPNHRPVRARQRRYPPRQHAFIETAVRELTSVGAIRHNPQARWASPALAVPKPGSDKLRFTVDLRAPNRETIPIASAMPDLEHMIQSTAGSNCFAKLDMCHAYWQIPLHKNSQECLSIQTPLGVHTPVRLLQGQTDAGNHFQCVTSPIFSEHIDNLVQWLDDFLLHEKREEYLLRSLSRFFGLCQEYGLKLHAKKCELFLKEAHFCGRLIDEKGIRYNPRELDTLLKMRKPEFASDLQQFLCATNWMRNSIPEYSKSIAPLHKLMEECYSKAKKRTKRAVKHISLTGLWGAIHDVAFKHVQSQIVQSTRLAHPKPEHRLSLFTDASETHWASVLTQVPDTQAGWVVEEQDHEPLAFLSGSFNGASANWSIVEKEAFSVVESMTRLDHFTATGVVSLYTDHANLVYIFDPYGRNPGMSRHTANKLMRWALKLSAYRYIIEHLPGERNVWADILTRWAVKPRAKVKSLKLASLFYAPITPETQGKYDWPARQDFYEAQKETNESPPKEFAEKQGIIQDKEGVFWIPADSELLRLRVLIAAHTGRGGHRGIEVTKRAVKEHFYWVSMNEDVEAFVKTCLHCLCSATGTIVPRPLGHSLHASLPNEILHFDYCFIGRSEKGLMYVLILKDDFSSFVWLFPFEAADASNTVDALMEWFSSFGVVLQWVSDRGSHFKNEVVAGLSEQLRGSHHFTLPYCPWTNGTVEVVCRELMRALRALTSEFQIPFRSWPSILPLIQSILNSTPLARLGGKCPLTAFTGLPGDNPLRSIKTEAFGNIEMLDIEEVRARQAANAEDLAKALENMHKSIKESADKARKARVDKHNARTHVRTCNFDIGDFVLRSFTDRTHTAKLSFRWRGPYRITKVLSDFLFEIEDLRSSKKATAHGTRLKLFRNKDLEVTTELLDQLSFQDGEYCVVDKILDIRVHNGEVQLLIKWKGFDDEQPAWESLDTMREDIPALVEDFLADIRTNGTARQQRVAKHC